MAIDKNKSLLMGKRLKELRESHGFSHESLKNKIYEAYGIEISVDSLKIYEVYKVPHSKAYKNEGMRIEYLRVFSDLYKVSTDYILGLTNIQSPDYRIGDIVEITGLTEDNVIALALAKRISQTYIPSCSEEGSGIPLRSYMPPADVSETYHKFVEKTGILNFFLPKDQTTWREYYKSSRDYDEMALALLAHVPDCVNDLISACLHDWSITSNHRTLCADFLHRNSTEIPDIDEVANDYKMAFSKGYTFIPIRAYLDYKVTKLGSSIIRFLSQKYKTDGNE